MNDPKKKRYLYLMLAGFGSISLSILTFFALYRLRGIGELFQNVASILAPFIYGGVDRSFSGIPLPLSVTENRNCFPLRRSSS